MIITITLNPAIDRRLQLNHAINLNKLNRAVSAVREPGGKGITVTRAINAIGGDSVAIGFCGGQNGRIIKDMMTSMNIMHDFVDIAGQSRVNIQIIDSDDNHTEFYERGPSIGETDLQRLIDKMQATYLDEKNIFVVTGSLPPKFTLDMYGRLLDSIKRAGCKLIVDAEGEVLAEALRHEPNFVKPSVREIAEFFGETPSFDPEVNVGRAKRMLEAGAQSVCVSMSHAGAVVASKHFPEYLYANCDPEIRGMGSIGTGDAMVGAIAHSVERDFDIYELAKFTVAVGRACARLPGTEMASLSRVFSVYETVKLYTV